MKIVFLKKLLFDQKRNRLIWSYFFFPSRKGSYPVLIFSHGNPVDPSAYFFLARHWSEKGYVCILPKHVGKSEQIENSKNWIERPRDITFLIDSLPNINRRSSALKGKLDLSRIGAGGHSHGAYMTLLLAGAKKTTKEPRIRAFLAVSPPGCGALGLTKSSFRSLSSSLMTIAGSNDQDKHFNRPASWRTDAFKYASSSSKKTRYHAVIQAANHYSFYDAPTVFDNTFTLSSLPLLKLQKKLTLGFWDQCLRPNTNAAKWFRKLTKIKSTSKTQIRISKK